MTAIEKIQAFAKRVANHDDERVKPGMPFRLTEAVSPGEGVWQGDLCIEVVDRVPAGYKRVAKPKAGDRQLVPGNTRGARHVVDKLKGVELHQPAGWPQSPETDFLGPCLVLTEERTITHPVHGPVTIAAGHTVLCSYQRNHDAVTKTARRNAD